MFIINTQWKYYFQRPVLIIFFLGFSAGLPFPLVYSTMTYWLAEANVVRSTIGAFAWLGFAYSFKVFWAPLVDQIKIPFLSKLLGRRRGWLLFCQLMLLFSLMCLANTNPLVDISLFALLAGIVAFFSATQDIVIDAYRIESAELKLQGIMAASYQYGYRVALIVATAGALFIAELASWSIAYQVMAVFMFVGLITTLICREPVTLKLTSQILGKNLYDKFYYWLNISVISPFSDFIRRYGSKGFVILAFISCFYVSDRVLGIMAMPFYEDIGFSKSQVATVAKLYGLWVSMFGAAIGGIAVVRIGLAKCIVLGSIFIFSTNLFFSFLAWVGADLTFLTITISFDNFAVGFGSTVMIAYMSSLVNMKYTATQYALLSSINTFLGKLLAGFSGDIQMSLGWINFFLYAAATGIPAILLALILARKGIEAN